MTDQFDDWHMADGFAPVSRLGYCEHPRACSAPSQGPCPRCQTITRPKRYRRMRKGVEIRMTGDSVPVFVDADFDDL